MEDTKYQDEKTSRSRNIKKLLSEVRLGIKSNTGMEPNKVNDPRGNHEGGPGSWRDFKDNPENSFPKHIERNAHLGMKSAPQPNEPNAFNPAGKNLPTVWLIGSEPHNFQKELGVNVDHFAIFPQALCEIPIKFGSPKGGLVLDPFMGSGTVAVVAKKLGRNYIGIELNKEYIKIAEKRIAAVPESLF
jgi:DNA modification methylase